VIKRERGEMLFKVYIRGGVTIGFILEKEDRGGGGISVVGG